MMHVIRIHATGNPDVMHLESIEQPMLRAGEILIPVALARINDTARQTRGKVVLLVE